MKEIKLERMRDLDILLSGLYSQPVKGLEALRLFDKVLTAIEHIAVVKYDESGNVVAFETDESGNVVMENDNPKRATRLKELPAVLRLEDGHAAFLKARVEGHNWPGQVARDVIRLTQQLGEAAERADQNTGAIE